MYYELDKKAAIAADTGSNRIGEKGKYIGRFTRAQHIEGIDFDFETTDGKRARFTLYTRKSDGTTIYGYKQLMAIMTCLKQNGLTEPQNLSAKIYDFDAGKEIDDVVPQFAELLNKPIGLLIHMEEYKKQDGEKKWRPAVSHAFEASTELMATEILDRKVTPQLLPKVLLTLQDRPLKDAPASTASAPNAYEAAKNGSPAYAKQPARAGGLDDLDSDIPF